MSHKKFVLLKKIMLILGINGALFAAAILIIELIFGGWLGLRNVSRLGVIQDQKIKNNISKLYSSDLEVSVATFDKHGLRGPCLDPSKIEILTVGGSTTQELLISDGRTWQDVLSIDLGKKLGKDPICIGNAGVGGQSTVGHIYNFHKWFPLIPNLKPKFVLFYIGINDIGTTIHNGILNPSNETQHQEHSWSKAFDDLKFFFSPIYVTDADESLACRTYSCYIRNYSVLYRIQEIVLGNLAARRLKIAHAQNTINSVVWDRNPKVPINVLDEKFLENGLARYKNNISKLANLTREIGSIPIFVNQRTMEYYLENGEIYGDSTETILGDKKINGVNKHYLYSIISKNEFEYCQSLNAICIDLFTSIEFKRSDFYDTIHTNENGSQKVGKFLSEELFRNSNFIKAFDP